MQIQRVPNELCILLWHKLILYPARDQFLLIAVPAVERIVYSTCSIHQIENEDVVQSILPLAESHGFELETPFPRWQRRGLPVFVGGKYHSPTSQQQIFLFFYNSPCSKQLFDDFISIAKHNRPCSHLAANHLLRTDPIEDKEGFFIALFKRKQDTTHSFPQTSNRDKSSRNRGGNIRDHWAVACPPTRMFKMWLYTHSLRTRWRKNRTPPKSITRTWLFPNRNIVEANDVLTMLFRLIRQLVLIWLLIKD